MVVGLNDGNFQGEVLDYKDTPVFVKFAAEWCQPCKIIEPVIEELSSEYAGKMKFGRLDIDDNSETAGRYSVMSIPTLIIFKDGQPVKQMLGAHSKESFKKVIDEAIK